MRIGRLVVALGIVALLTTPALAQQRGGRGGGFGQGAQSLGTLAQNKSVQDEVKITEDQAKKITEAITKLREGDLKDDYAKLGGGRGGRRGGGGGGGGGGASQEERAAARKKVNEAEEKAVKTVLDDKQMKRLEQIHVQNEGLTAFTQDEDVQKALKLTSEQKDKIKAISDDLQKEMGELRGGGGGGRGRGGNPEMQQKIQSLRKEAVQNAVKVLSDEQKKAYKDLTGESFEVKPNQGGKPRTDF
jgi:hypothetical protein